MSGPPPPDRRPVDTSAGSRARILERIRAVRSRREAVGHPGRFVGGRPEAPGESALEAFETAFQAAGGATRRLPDLEAARDWLSRAAAGGSIAVGERVPAAVVPDAPRVAPDEAALAISWAQAAVAETGTLVLNASDGRRVQLLAPKHAILVPVDAVRETLAEALAAVRSERPSAFGLHSGPSKSADIGQVMVRGVHGPGDVTALVFGAARR